MGFLNPINNTNEINEKIGNSTDIWNGNSTVLGYANVSYKHVHNPAICYPTLADGITINTSSTAWTLGDFTEIIPANTINVEFDMHFINFEDSSTTGVYELHLFSGEVGEEVLIATIRTSRDANQSGITSVPVQVPVQHANARISGRLASDGGNRNVTLSVYYHTYA